MKHHSAISHRVGLLILWLCVAVQPIAVHAAAQAPTPLSALCASHCVTPYGAVLGIAHGKVPAYSNCSSSCVITNPNRYAGTYTGIKWQCVEFARRWLLVNKGLVYGDVDVAADIWSRITYLTRVADQKRIQLSAYLNGASQAPQVGDLLIYAREYQHTGHVAVIVAVDAAAGSIEVAEQNFANNRWPGDYARKIALIRRDGRYWVLDAYVLGWKGVRQ